MDRILRQYRIKAYPFRLHIKNLPGKPDITLKKYNTVIFVHGCFWHRHPGCKRASMPKSNKKYWVDKFKRNVMRFKDVEQELKNFGWNVEIIWECEIKDLEKLSQKLDLLLKSKHFNL